MSSRGSSVKALAWTLLRAVMPTFEVPYATGEIKSHLLYGWIRKRARGRGSCVLIGYLSRQDGLILPVLISASEPRKKKFSLWLYRKSFIDQACLVKMHGWIFVSSFFIFIDLNFILVHKNAKKELAQYLAILTSCLVNNAYLCNI